MNTYEVIQYRVWIATDGRKASIYGATPYVNDIEKAYWRIDVLTKLHNVMMFAELTR